MNPEPYRGQQRTSPYSPRPGRGRSTALRRDRYDVTAVRWGAPGGPQGYEILVAAAAGWCGKLSTLARLPGGSGHTTVRITLTDSGRRVLGILRRYLRAAEQENVTDSGRSVPGRESSGTDGSY